MKRVLFLMLIYALMMAGVFVFAFQRKTNTIAKRDMSYFNDYMYRISEEWNAEASEEALEKAYDCFIVLFDENNGSLTPELSMLYSEHALVMDFAPAGEVIGKVAWKDLAHQIKDAEDAVFKKSVILWAFVFVVGELLIVILYFGILRPSEKMEAFAEDIAKGKLDIPLPRSRDNVFGNLTVSFDIMREELKAAREREVAAEKAKKEMALSLSHDIKTPVATIKSVCEMIELLAQKHEGDDQTVDSIVDKVRIIDKKADIISSLSDNIFHVNLAETEHIRVEQREEESTLVEEYFRQLRGYGSIVLENSIPPCLVYMDRLRMEQVVDNIVGNSHKYAGTEIRVRFDMTETFDGKDWVRYVRITVRDSGPGVPEEELSMIAEKFYRGKNTEGKPGAGLGMYLAGWYMEKQGGGMEYYNDNGFVVELLLKVV